MPQTSICQLLFPGCVWGLRVLKRSEALWAWPQGIAGDIESGVHTHTTQCWGGRNMGWRFSECEGHQKWSPQNLWLLSLPFPLGEAQRGELPARDHTASPAKGQGFLTLGEVALGKPSALPCRGWWLMAVITAQLVG